MIQNWMHEFQNAAKGAQVKSKIQNFFACLSLFLLAFLPRAYDLQRFVTADEAKWVYRSAQFLMASLRGDWAATSVNLTPAVTTTWLGSLGLALYYQFNRAVINLSFTDWLASLPEFRVELGVLAATRWPMVVLTSLSVVVFYLLACRLFNSTLAFLAAVFMALDPQPVALSRILGHDAPTAVFMSLAVLLLLLTIKPAGEQGSRGAGEIFSLPRSPAPALRRAGLASETPEGASGVLTLILSGVAAGLAFLSKAPAFFLIPLTAMVLAISEIRFSRLGWLKPFTLWLVVAYLTFVICWPAAWIDPVGQPLAVFQNAFLSATDQEEADDEGYWLVPDLGPFYYLVNGGFKLSPLVMVGVGLAAIFWTRRRVSGSSFIASPLLWLFIFILLFTIFMTASDKRSARYILPIFPPLAIIAAYGWLQLYQVASSKVAGSRVANSRVVDDNVADISYATRHTPQATRLTSHISHPTSQIARLTFITILILSALVILLPYAPYYFTYFNPLLGGPFTAPHLVKIGWGEGLDRVGRFLQREDQTRGSRVGTAYASTVAPFFDGDLSSVTGDYLDYVVLYSKQVQSGEPSPTFIRYFEHIGSIFPLNLNGIHYADVYPGPTLQTLPPPLSGEGRGGGLPTPIAFRPLTPYGHIGEPLEIDVVWQADDPLPTTPATVTLAPIAALDLLKADDQAGSASLLVNNVAMLATGDSLLTRTANDLVVSRHRLRLPTDLARGPYALLVDGQPLGQIELRHFQIPEHMGQVQNVIFGNQPADPMSLSGDEKDRRLALSLSNGSAVGGQRPSPQIALAAYQFEPTADYIGVTIAWQAQTSPLPDYTVFVQILTAETKERLAGVDTPPQKGEWPTSRWVKGEVIVDEYLVAIPPDLPPGFYEIIAGLYLPETGQRLILADGQDHWTLPWTYIQK
jgi:hypothetical protein